MSDQPRRMSDADVLAECLETIVATWPPPVSEREHRRDFRDRQRIAVEVLARLAARGYALSSPETTPAGVLDEAWAAAEKALPEGWRLSVAQHPDNCAAFAMSGVVSREGAPVGLGPTPAAALHALAAALGRSGSGGGRG